MKYTTMFQNVLIMCHLALNSVEFLETRDESSEAFAEQLKNVLKRVKVYNNSAVIVILTVIVAVKV